ncbi:MAG TPA: hypothetical protein VLK59_13605 [Solirubrobacteraceae bacterium]|nr:hypothetical protein [Solirubrobacteraceae bacterium]
MTPTPEPTPEATPTPAPTPPEAGRLSRGRRYGVRAALIVGTILAVFAIVAVFANRQVLNSDNWANTSDAMLENQAIRTQISANLVDQVYANVDVTSEVANALPPRLKPLAGPAANGLRELAQRRMIRLLDRPRVQQAWKEANRLTAKQFIAIAEGNSKAITRQGNAVVLNLREILIQLVNNLGLPRSLSDKIPPDAGRITIMSSSQVGTLQNGVSALKGLALVLPILALGLLAFAVYLAEGRRRRTLLFAGIDLVLAGAIVLVARNVVGSAVVDSLAKTDAAKPAAEAAWTIGTALLRDAAQAVIIVGIPVIIAAWLAGPMRPAVAFRRAAAPWLRDRPGLVYSIAGVLVLLVVLWGPIPATRKVVPVLIMIGLVALGVQALRRQTAEEFPEATAGATRASLGAAASRAQHAVLGARGSGGASTSATTGRVEQLERLAHLHDTGALTDDEYATEKTAVLAKGAST